MERLLSPAPRQDGRPSFCSLLPVFLFRLVFVFVFHLRVTVSEQIQSFLESTGSRSDGADTRVVVFGAVTDNQDQPHNQWVPGPMEKWGSLFKNY